MTRVRLTKALSQAIAHYADAERPSALLVIAIENLPSINSTFGFEIGDEVIGAVDRIIKATLGGKHKIARYASNRLGVVLDTRRSDEVTPIASTLLEAVRSARIETSACRLTASISIGAVIIPQHASTPAEALRNALRALEETVKRATPFLTYDPSLEPAAGYRHNTTLIGELMRGMDEGRMRFDLQPIVNAKTEVIELYECLLRLVKEDGTIVSAGSFIEVAEQLGLAREIDRHTLTLAVDLLKQHPALRLSLNVSQHTTKDETWLSFARALMGTRPDIAQRLMIEITETALLRNMSQMASFVAAVRDLGCSTAIDDFGTGYTSFMQVKHLELDVLKIDGNYVKNLPDDAESAVFVRTMVDIAHTFGLKTVAEWVADGRIAKFLIDTGVDYLQGFHYGQPISPDQLPR